MSGKEDPCYKLKVQQIELLKNEVEIVKKRMMILMKTGNKDEVADIYVEYITLLYRLSAEIDVLKLRECMNDDDINTEANNLGSKLATTSMMATMNIKMEGLKDKQLVDKDKFKEDPKAAFTEMIGTFGDMFGDIFAATDVRPKKKEEKTKKVQKVSDSEEEEIKPIKEIKLKKIEQKDDKGKTRSKEEKQKKR